MKDVFRSGDSSKKFKIAECQWYRYAPSYVSPAYHLLEGFPFIQEPPSGDLQERVLIRHHDYDQCFYSFQAEDGIRDFKVTVVQTCALPISRPGQASRSASGAGAHRSRRRCAPADRQGASPRARTSRDIASSRQNADRPAPPPAPE